MKNVNVYILGAGDNPKILKSETDITYGMIKHMLFDHVVLINGDMNFRVAIPPAWNKSERSRAAYLKEHGAESLLRRIPDDYPIHERDFVSAAPAIKMNKTLQAPNRKKPLTAEGLGLFVLIATLAYVFWHTLH